MKHSSKNFVTSYTFNISTNCKAVDFIPCLSKFALNMRASVIPSLLRKKSIFTPKVFKSTL